MICIFPKSHQIEKWRSCIREQSITKNLRHLSSEFFKEKIFISKKSQRKNKKSSFHCATNEHIIPQKSSKNYYTHQKNDQSSFFEKKTLIIYIWKSENGETQGNIKKCDGHDKTKPLKAIPKRSIRTDALMNS